MSPVTKFKRTSTSKKYEPHIKNIKERTQSRKSPCLPQNEALVLRSRHSHPLPQENHHNHRLPRISTPPSKCTPAVIPHRSLFDFKRRDSSIHPQNVNRRSGRSVRRLSLPNGCASRGHRRLYYAADNDSCQGSKQIVGILL